MVPEFREVKKISYCNVSFRRESTAGGNHYSGNKIQTLPHEPVSPRVVSSLLLHPSWPQVPPPLISGCALVALISIYCFKYAAYLSALGPSHSSGETKCCSSHD